MGQFAYSNLITPLTSLDDGAYWAFYGVSWAVWAVVLVVLTRRLRQNRQTITREARIAPPARSPRR